MDNSIGQAPFVPWTHITLYFCTSHKTGRLFQASEPQWHVQSFWEHRTAAAPWALVTTLGAARENVWVTAASLLSPGEKSPVFIVSCSSKTLFAPKVSGTRDIGSSMILGFSMRQSLLLTAGSFTFPPCSEQASLGAKEPHNFATCLKWEHQQSNYLWSSSLGISTMFSHHV